MFISAEAEEGGVGAERRRGRARRRKSHPSAATHADHQRPQQPRGKEQETGSHPDGGVKVGGAQRKILITLDSRKEKH